MGVEKPGTEPSVPATDQPDKLAPPAASQGGDAVGTGADEPVSEQEALFSLQGENAERIDAARSIEIVENKLDQLRDPHFAAETLVYFAGGVSVAGDFNAGVRGRRRQAGGPVAVDQAHFIHYTTGYVEPAGFADALATLEKSHLLVLAAAGGTGRDAAALTLLERVVPTRSAAGRPGLFLLPADGLFHNAGWSVPDSRCGYLVTSRLSGDLDDAWLTRTSSVLAAAGSYLVLVTDPVSGTLTDATRRHDFVVAHLQPPDPMAVVRARVLLADSAPAADEVERLLAGCGVPALLAERPLPRFAVRVAAAVVAALTAGEDLVDALAALCDPAEQVQEWFGHHTEPDQVAFAVATAVLEGSSYLTLSDAAVDLYRALVPEAGASGASGTLRFRRNLAGDQPWIELTAPEARPSGGVPVAESVRFRSQRLQAAVLGYAWNHLDGIRPELATWLRRQVAHADVEVRARAATSTGLLAAGDFQHILHRYLRPWAASDSTALRQSAALALGVVGSFAGHTARVWALLRQWAQEVRLGRRRLPETAAVAAGGPLGRTDPRQALRVLRMLLSEGDWGLMTPVALSVLNLVENGRPGEVLQALFEWTDPDDGELAAVKGLLAFVFAARQPAVDGNDAAPDETVLPAWPVLLADAHCYRDELPELWGRALDTSAVRPLALESLREWLRVADGDPRAFLPVRDVLAGIADRGDRDAERLEYHLDKWAEDEDDPSAAAGRMLDDLIEAEAR